MNIVYIVFMILGCFFGAGFVSGKEVANYFSVYGPASYVGIFVLAIVMFLLLAFFLSVARNIKGLGDFSLKYFGRWGWLLNFLLIVSMLVFIGSMIAGTQVLCEDFLLPKIPITIVTFIVVFFVVVSGNNGIGKINIVLVPFMILVLLYLMFSNLVCGFEVVGFSLSSIFSSVSYGFINIVPLGIFLIEISNKNNYSKKEGILISAVVTIIIIFLILVYNNTIIAYGLENAEMPILMLAKGRGKLLRGVIFVSLYSGLMTTMISCVFVVCNYINCVIKNYKHSTMLTLVCGLIISFFGFSKIVGYVYIVVGFIGLFLIVSMLIKEIRNLKNSSF